MSSPRAVSRRVFVGSALATGAGLALGFTILASRRSRSSKLEPNLWLRIDTDGAVHVRVHKVEMGQGVLTALPMILAEELGADWSRVRVEQADADFRFTDQNTSGSSSIIDSWGPLRKAGATARSLLTSAASRRWAVPPDECEAERGYVMHRRSGRRASFGELVEEAARLPFPDPERVALRDSRSYSLVGSPTRRVDTREKVRGQTRYGMDQQLPGMLYAVVERAPSIGGTLRLLDDTATLAVPGVHRVIRLPADPPSRLPERVAVIARDSWSALRGRAVLRAEWHPGPNADLSDRTIDAAFRAAERDTPAVPRDDGDALAAGVRRSPSLVATYALPYLAHAPMEPINCTAHAREDGIELWAPTQFPQRAVQHVSRALGVAIDRIRLHVVPMGGGFGRRVYPDFAVEAAQIAKIVGAPVKTFWTREDDIRNDFFRPATRHRLSAVLGADGVPRAWLHEMTGPSIAKQLFGDRMEPADSEIGGAIDIPYAIPNVRLEFRLADIPVPLGVWRSVSQSQNTFVVECFIDELAHLARIDPLRYRLGLLGSHPRLAAVLRLAAERAGWGSPLPPGRGRGVAICTYGSTCVAQIAEVALIEDRLRVERVTCAIDCGIVINPLGVEAQIEGGIGWGLSAALAQRITFRDGRAEQSGFSDFPVLRMADMPRVDVHIARSQEEPGGVGEPGVSPIAPAVANALFAAAGQRVRRLPLSEALPLASRRTGQ